MGVSFVWNVANLGKGTTMAVESILSSVFDVATYGVAISILFSFGCAILGGKGFSSLLK